MFKKLLDRFTFDIGIDLGTANTLVCLRGLGVVFNEPSVVAINKLTGEVLAVGREARKMIGRTPSHIVSSNPLQDGVINDFDSTEAMLRYFIGKVHKKYGGFLHIPKPRVVIGVPSKITEVEIRAVLDAAKSAGARRVYLLEEGMASAIGAHLPIETSSGHMVVDIGGGTTDIAVISLGGVVADNTIKVAGNEMDRAIVDYVRRKYNFLIGEKMAEDVKISIGCVIPPKKKIEKEIRGRDLLSGLPKSMKISNVEIREAILPIVERIGEALKEVVEDIPPEILSDLLENGVVLSGGGALIVGMDKYFNDLVNLPIIISSRPLESVVSGTLVVIEELDLLEKVKFNYEEIV